MIFKTYIIYIIYICIFKYAYLYIHMYICISYFFCVPLPTIFVQYGAVVMTNYPHEGLIKSILPYLILSDIM